MNPTTAQPKRWTTARNVDLLARNLALAGGRSSLQVGEQYGLQVEVSNIDTQAALERTKSKGRAPVMRGSRSLMTVQMRISFIPAQLFPTLPELTPPEPVLIITAMCLNRMRTRQRTPPCHIVEISVCL